MLMSLPITSALILIFVLWLQYEIRKDSRSSKRSLELFWKKEQGSNLTRKKDISELSYLTVSLDSLPMEDHEDETINSYRDLIRNYSGRKMLNLSGLTNTELKYRYGAANITLLSEYDNNYTAFVSMLQKWAQRLMDKGYEADAQRVLEFSIHSCLTDVTGAYRLLARIYHNQNSADKIDSIIHIIPRSSIRDKEKLTQELEAVKNRLF